MQTSSKKDNEGVEQTQCEEKVKQLQDELEVTDQQIMALNPHLYNTLRQRCVQWEGNVLKLQVNLYCCLLFFLMMDIL